MAAVVEFPRQRRRRRDTMIRDAILRGRTGGSDCVPKRVLEWTRYQFRRGLQANGVRFPDARDLELKDAGIELAWRIGVLRRELRRRQS